MKAFWFTYILQIPWFPLIHTFNCTLDFPPLQSIYRSPESPKAPSQSPPSALQAAKQRTTTTDRPCRRLHHLLLRRTDISDNARTHTHSHAPVVSSPEREMRLRWLRWWSYKSFRAGDSGASPHISITGRTEGRRARRRGLCCCEKEETLDSRFFGDFLR